MCEAAGWVGKLHEAPAPTKVDAPTLGWSPELPAVTSFPLDCLNSLCDKSLGLQAILHNVFRCQSDLLKQKPNYVTSLLKILKWFPMENVFFKLLFLAAKPFLQIKMQM